MGQARLVHHDCAKPGEQVKGGNPWEKSEKQP